MAISYLQARRTTNTRQRWGGEHLVSGMGCRRQKEKPALDGKNRALIVMRLLSSLRVHSGREGTAGTTNLGRGRTRTGRVESSPFPSHSPLSTRGAGVSSSLSCSVFNRGGKVYEKRKQKEKKKKNVA